MFSLFLENPGPSLQCSGSRHHLLSILVLSFTVLPPDVVVTGPTIRPIVRHHQSPSPQPQLSVASASPLSTFPFLVLPSAAEFCRLWPASHVLVLLFLCAFFLSLFSISGSCFLSSSELLNTDVFRQHLFLAVHCRQHTSSPGNSIHAVPSLRLPELLCPRPGFLGENSQILCDLWSPGSQLILKFQERSI